MPARELASSRAYLLVHGPRLERSYPGAGGTKVKSMPGSCRPVRWQLALGDVEKEPERAVHGLGILEDLGNVGVEKHNVGAGFVLLVMLPPRSGGEVVFRSHVIVTHRIALLHTFSAPLARPLEQ